MGKVLSLKNVEKYYGNMGNVTKALDQVSFDVEHQEFIAIMGASASGKTTLLNCIATIDRVSSGNIFVEDQNITSFRGSKLSQFRSNKLGFIFQEYNLLDTLTAYENIALALSIQNVNYREIDNRVNNIAKQLEISNILNRYPCKLSGGEKQRVACARAIVTNPSIVLADEPTGALDSKSARLLLEKFEQLNNELKTTILMVTHDAYSASYAKRVLFIKDGKMFNELYKGDKSRKEFFNEIIDVVSLLGGELDDIV